MFSVYQDGRWNVRGRSTRLLLNYEEFNPTYNFFLPRLFSEQKILSVLFPPSPVKIFPIFFTRLHFVTWVM